jgi:hypothetical protein
LEPRPEPDVHRRGVLGLNSSDPLERTRDRYPAPLEQELTRQQCPVQLALCERSLGAQERAEPLK